MSDTIVLNLEKAAEAAKKGIENIEDQKDDVDLDNLSSTIRKELSYQEVINNEAIEDNSYWMKIDKFLEQNRFQDVLNIIGFIAFAMETNKSSFSEDFSVSDEDVEYVKELIEQYKRDGCIYTP